MNTRKKFAEDLAKEYDFESKEQYFEYIVDSLINGNRSQVRELFNQMHADDKEYFLINWLHGSSWCNSIKNICIGELCHNPKGA